MANPIYYPGANRTALWFNDTHDGGEFIAGTSRRVVLHSTEGTGMPGYSGGSVAPHLTAMPNFTAERFDWYQHFRLDRYARALNNPSGGVETNRLGALQVEIVGTCDRTVRWERRHLEMWNLPSWAVLELAEFVKWCHDEQGIDYAFPARWPAYNPQVPQPSGVRMGATAWTAFDGVCGHLHVPENSHRDPGDLPIELIVDIAKGQDMALTEAQTVAAVVKALKTNIARNDNGASPDELTLSVADFIQMNDRKMDALTDSMKTVVAGLADVSSLIAQLPIDVPAIDAAFQDATERIIARLSSLHLTEGQ